MNSEYQSIDETIYSIDPDNIVCKKKSPLMALLFLFIGADFFAVNYLVPGIYNNPDLSSAVLMAGAVFGLIGIVKLLMNLYGKSAVPVYKPSGERLKRYELFFDAAYRDTVNKYVQAGDFDALVGLPHSESSAILVVIYKTSTGDILLAQVFEYVPYHHEPVTDTLVFDKSRYRLSGDIA